MGDVRNLNRGRQQRQVAARKAGGEIVEVQGGHIVRSTGRKDRHSKVCTAKGPRDRRVRLSAHTAIQFYDVQDRLGYDRPSKAVDWLIKKAKPAIDELAELPAWNPITGLTANADSERDQERRQHDENPPPQQFRVHGSDAVDESENGSFLPPSMESGSIADTIKSFFPTGASAEANSPAIPFHSFSRPDFLSITSSESQDLRLSLQSFEDPILLHHHHSQSSQHQPATAHNEQALFSGNLPMGFTSAGWSESHSPEIGRFQRMASWEAGGDAGSSGGEPPGFVFNSPPAPPFLQPLFGQTQMFSERGPLQSSITPSFRAWMDPPATTISTGEHQPPQFHPSAISGFGFAGGGGFSGFHIPARIQGDEEEHDGISDKPSSASSDSRH